MLYHRWIDIKRRCLNKNRNTYKYYGGRNITVCEEWLDFEVFRDWALANGYKEELSIDRIDNNHGYYPTNCQWIPRGKNSQKDKGKPVNQFDLSGNLIATHLSMRSIERQTGIDRRSVSAVCKGKRKMAGGYKWLLGDS